MVFAITNINRKHPLRIALLTDGIWPFVIGGMQKHSYYLCKYFADEGIYVDLYHPKISDGDKQLSSIFSGDQIRFIRVFWIDEPRVLPVPGHYLRSSYLFSKAIAAVLVKHVPDIVYAKGLTSWYLLEQRQRLNFLPPVCINVHGYEYFQRAASVKNMLQQIMLRSAFRTINRKADVIFSYGRSITKLIRKHIGEVGGRIIEIPAAVEKSVVNESGITSMNRTRRFIFIGRYERRKGIEELMNVISTTVFPHPYEFHFIGNVPEHLRVSRNYIHYHGKIADKESILHLLSASDVLVCPSYAEGMPNVVLEAMARGCAIIASHIGAVPDMVDDLNGWLIAPGSKAQLRSAMIEALQIPDEDLIKRKQNSLKRVQENFLWESVISGYKGVFNEIAPEVSPVL